MSSKRLICEEDVLALGVGESIHLDAFTIITPSALDAAFRRGIAVHREADSSGRKAGKQQACLWHRILETDGTFVVQVVDGHAQVNRLTAEGPVTFGTDSTQDHHR